MWKSSPGQGHISGKHVGEGLQLIRVELLAPSPLCLLGIVSLAVVSLFLKVFLGICPKCLTFLAHLGFLWVAKYHLIKLFSAYARQDKLFLQLTFLFNTHNVTLISTVISREKLHSNCSDEGFCTEYLDTLSNMEVIPFMILLIFLNFCCFSHLLTPPTF